MAVQIDEEEGNPKIGNGDANPVKSKQTKRLRWATQRATPSQAQSKRASILARFHRRSGSGSTGQSDIKADGTNPNEEGIKDSGRTVYFNRPLPDSAKDEDGKPLHHFPRNKVRTAKYTPLTFIPKDLWLQFHNIANVYFAFIIILSIFSIFGASNPGLNAVPLIVILTVTGIKDGIEDFRRTVLDNELNNSPVHRLVDWNNVNTADEKISLWRRFKKANSRLIATIWAGLKKRKSTNKDKLLPPQREIRPSVETRPSTNTERTSFQSAESRPLGEDIQMTPVQPSRRSQDRPGYERESTNFSNTDGVVDSVNGYLSVPNEKGDHNAAATGASHTKRSYGSIIDPTKVAEGKARFKKEYWKNVQVGDFVRLYNEEQVPADIVVLATSDPDGACYVETKNLDGETNLKVRQALHCGRKVKRAKDCERTDFWIESEAPHANLYSYSGVARWYQKNSKMPNETPEEKAEPITINNLLLRGCNLKNTEWILGVVVYSGDETKIMLNAGITPSKRAKISRDLNWNVIYNFIILFIMCLISAIGEGTYWGKSDTSVDFFEYGSYGGTAGLNGFITFWAAIILFQNLVPISLYITLEIIRTCQAFFIYSDYWMYYAKVDYPCTPKSWNISDDLGQIEYIFSDKTGTLTQNVMEFRKATVGGVPYGEAYTEAQAGMQKRKGVNVEEEGARAREQIAADRQKMLADLRSMHDNPYLVDDDLTFVAPDFVNDLKGQSGEKQKEATRQFMLALAICHTVIADRTPGDPPRIEFKAQSPDEAALVATARDCGFTVIGRTNDGIIINVMGTDTEYTVLNILEFNSSRKRMSAIVRMPDGKIVLFCKGADSVIYSRLKAGQQADLRRATAEHLEMFAREGLRTLCIAQKEIPEEEYQAWNKQHDTAAAAIQNRDEKLEEVSNAIERDLELIGGTAIEDRLQDGVPDAIALLGNAGIKLWVLTGDKVETAINIGFSCNLLNNDMDLIIFNIEDESLSTAEAQLDENLAKFGITGSDEDLVAAKKNHEPPDPTHALIIDGDSLKLVLDDTLRQKFLLLCKQCKSVLCCRVSPSQKAAVVQMVKRGLEVITLSIGDGANDVAMIQEADVGVGIAGEEGRQAVMSSDFAIGQFRFLARLTLVHGRWCYRRMAEVIANFFYKNMVWTWALFWYNIYDNFDCSYVFDYTYIILFNLAFTSLAVIFQGIFDQDVSDKVSLAVPQLYRRGIERLEWTQRKFWLYMFDGFYQSLICFFMAYLIFAPATFQAQNGLDLSESKLMGMFIAHAAVLTVNVYILLNTYRWDYATLGIVAFSVLLIFFWTGVYTLSTYSFQFLGGATEVYGSLIFWALTLLVVIICLLPRFSIKVFQKFFLPRDADIIREQVFDGQFDYLETHMNMELGPTSAAPLQPTSPSSSDGTPSKDTSKFSKSRTPEDERPIIHPPSTAQTGTTDAGGNQHSAQGSDSSWPPAPPRISLERPSRPSFDRMKSSLDKIRPSFEASRDFTSASLLTRVESSHSTGTPERSPLGMRKWDVENSGS